jgi:hypothetical protein
MRPFILALALLATTAGADNLVERGKYIVTTSGCHDCHTPLMQTPQGPVPNFSRELSGHPEDMPLPPPPRAIGPWLWGGVASNTAFWGPWGVSYSTNITSDRDTGIGNWKEADFVQAMRTGKHLGAGRPILPPMPWQALSAMKEDDLKAIYAYLQGTRAIRNQVPEANINAAPEQ